MKAGVWISTAAVFGLAIVNAQAAPVPLGVYYKGGTGADMLLSGATTNGVTLTYQANTDAKTDMGVYANAAATFATVGDKLVYRYTYQNIVCNFNSANTVRTGFDLGASAALHFTTGYGTNPDGRFSMSYSGNPFNSGTQFGVTSNNFVAAGSGLLFDDGNKINATLTLELVALDTVTGTNHSYRLSAYYANATTNVGYATQVFTGVNGTVVDKVYHITPTAGVKVNGDTWTLANASAEFIPYRAPATLSLVVVGTSP